jgi:hypothetical protein
MAADGSEPLEPKWQPGYAVMANQYTRTVTYNRTTEPGSLQNFRYGAALSAVLSVILPVEPRAK